MKKLLLNFLFWLCKLESSIILKRFEPQIIAVTGSIAKTSTKEAIFEILKIKFGHDVSKSYGNLNNELGVPLAILGFKHKPQIWLWPGYLIIGFFRAFFVQKYPQILVLEFAADKPGDIKYLTSFIKPQIAIITSIGPTHLEKFKTIKAVANEKSRLVKILPKNGYAILNKSDKNVLKMAKYTKARIIYFGGTGFEIFSEAAKAVGTVFGINEQKMNKVLKNKKFLQGRMNLLEGVKNSKIIDDTYNSNPMSCMAALDYLSSFKGKKVAILGSMLELGDFSKKAHKDIARKARKKVSRLILVGNEFRNIQEADKWYQDSSDAAQDIKNFILDNDVILVKGSRGMEMEKVVSSLKK